MSSRLASPIAGQIYRDGNNEFKILKIENNTVYMQNQEDMSDIFTMEKKSFQGLIHWKLIKSGGKSKKRRRKNKRRTLRSGKIRNFFGF